MGRKPQVKGGSVLTSIPKSFLRRDGILNETDSDVEVNGSFYFNRIRRGVYVIKHSDVVSDEIGESDELVDRVEEFVDDVNEHVREKQQPTA